MNLPELEARTVRGSNQPSVADRTRTVQTLWAALGRKEDAVGVIRVELAKELAALRAAFPRRGTWEAHCRMHFAERSLGDIRKLVSIGEADDPQATHEAENRRRREAEAKADAEADRRRPWLGMSCHDARERWDALPPIVQRLIDLWETMPNESRLRCMPIIYPNLLRPREGAV